MINIFLNYFFLLLELVYNNKMSKIYELLPSSFTIVKEYEGHICKKGSSAGKIFNPYALVENNGNQFYAMFCNPNNLTYFSIEDLNKVKYNEKDEDRTWYYHTKLGYIGNTTNIFLHQLIMDYYGNGKGQNSIDHINQNKLDNRRENLRITNQGIQNENRGKKARNSSAYKEISQDVLNYIQEVHNHQNLPKFVEYNLDLKNDKPIKEYFLISKNHPILKFFNSPPIKTTQGMKVPILDKYKQVEKGIHFLDNMAEKPKEEWVFNKDDFIEFMRE